MSANKPHSCWERLNAAAAHITQVHIYQLIRIDPSSHTSVITPRGFQTSLNTSSTVSEMNTALFLSCLLQHTLTPAYFDDVYSSFWEKPVGGDILSYGVKTHKNTIYLLHFITRCPLKYCSWNCSEVSQCNWLTTNHVIFCSSHWADTTKWIGRSSNIDSEKQRSPHMHSGIPWGTGRVESFFRQEDNEQGLQWIRVQIEC